MTTKIADWYCRKWLGVWESDIALTFVRCPPPHTSPAAIWRTLPPYPSWSSSYWGKYGDEKCSVKLYLLKPEDGGKSESGEGLFKAPVRPPLSCCWGPASTSPWPARSLISGIFLLLEKFKPLYERFTPYSEVGRIESLRKVCRLGRPISLTDPQFLGWWWLGTEWVVRNSSYASF